MEYLAGYVVFGMLFLAGTVGYWIVTRAFKDVTSIYGHEPEPSGGRRGS